MKKLFSIAMIFTLLYNMGGYLLLFQYFIKKSDDFANEQISRGVYNASELVEIKVSMGLPYIQGQNDYESFSGQVEIKGYNYNYVALKITPDTMYVQCVPNHEKTRLVNENIIRVEGVSDMPLQKKNRAPVEKKSGIDYQYFYTVKSYDPDLNGQSLKKPYNYISSQKLRTYLTTPAQPPEQGILS